AGSVPAFHLQQPKDVERPAVTLRPVRSTPLEVLPNRRLPHRRSVLLPVQLPPLELLQAQYSPLAQRAILHFVQLTPLEFPQAHDSFRTSFRVKNPRCEITDS